MGGWCSLGPQLSVKAMPWPCAQFQEGSRQVAIGYVLGAAGGDQRLALGQGPAAPLSLLHPLGHMQTAWEV